MLAPQYRPLFLKSLAQSPSLSEDSLAPGSWDFKEKPKLCSSSNNSGNQPSSSKSPLKFSAEDANIQGSRGEIIKGDMQDFYSLWDLKQIASLKSLLIEPRTPAANQEAIVTNDIKQNEEPRVKGVEITAESSLKIAAESSLKITAESSLKTTATTKAVTDIDNKAISSQQTEKDILNSAGSSTDQILKEKIDSLVSSDFIVRLKASRELLCFSYGLKSLENVSVLLRKRDADKKDGAIKTKLNSKIADTMKQEELERIQLENIVAWILNINQLYKERVSNFCRLLDLNALEKSYRALNILIDTINVLTEGLALILGKCISLIVGDYESLEISKLETKPVLFSKPKTQTNKFAESCVKASLQQYSDHRNLVMHRYPSYYLDDPELIGCRLPEPSLQLGRQLAQFYPLNTQLDATFSVQAHLEASRLAVFDPPYLEDVQTDTPQIPAALLEAEAVFKKYMWETSANAQMESAKEIKKRKQFWKFMDGPTPAPINSIIEKPELTRIDQLYTILESKLPGYITMMVRLLFYLNVSPNAEPYSNTHNLEIIDTLDESKKAEEIVNRDATRHKEIITKSVSKIILDILKSSKRHHILAFENVNLLLVDNNAPILILKMLSSWFANPNLKGVRKNAISDEVGEIEDLSIGTAWLQERPLPSELNFFRVFNNETGSSHALQQDASEHSLVEERLQRPSSKRNFNITINLLRILQKMSKNKTNRILAMVQWKANAVFKRILKVPNPTLHIYSLKLLKSQIPYLGKKWKANNMVVISAIYMNLRHRLKEEYLSGDFDADAVEASKSDQELRELIAEFNARRKNDSQLHLIDSMNTVDLNLDEEDEHHEHLDFKSLNDLDYLEEDSLVLSLDETDCESESDGWDEGWTDGSS